MSIGFKTFGAGGNVEIDTTLVTWNLVEMFEVPANTNVIHQYPELTGLAFGALQIPIEVPKVQDYTYEKTIEVKLLNGIPTVNVYGGNQSAFILVACR